MFSIVLTVAIILSALDSSMGCATSENVIALDIVVSQMNASQQPILHNASMPTIVKYSTILGLVCDNPLVLQLAKAIEQQVVSCPDLVTASKVGALQLGPLTFSDLLEKFQSFDHFCECKPLLLQVLSVEMIKHEIMYQDSSAFYKNIVNITAVCMLTSPSHSVNFTEVATLVEAHKASCPAVFQYSTISMTRFADYILSHCSYHNPKLFTCALNLIKKDNTLSLCLTLINQNMTSEESLDAKAYRCRRKDCAKMSLYDCEYHGAAEYMWAVNIAHTDKQFQMLRCHPIPVSEASHIIHTTWVLISTIMSVLILNTMI
ncbi:uncharacterized protein LOC132739696 [Ruditapes philippinarum]|uniref:uncharacterized protein LOC132739696 n=1 Tax=Ruditapes philippinarum TaxID=129788 RepID=UPI00295C34CA|nr:uncharacterized protein LOC132739696 [Ruditapes philippinarum]